jgi:hypothetical protein
MLQLPGCQPRYASCLQQIPERGDHQWHAVTAVPLPADPGLPPCEHCQPQHDPHQRLPVPSGAHSGD